LQVQVYDLAGHIVGTPFLLKGPASFPRPLLWCGELYMQPPSRRLMHPLSVPGGRGTRAPVTYPWGLGCGRRHRIIGWDFFSLRRINKIQVYSDIVRLCKTLNRARLEKPQRPADMV